MKQFLIILGIITLLPLQFYSFKVRKIKDKNLKSVFVKSNSKSLYVLGFLYMMFKFISCIYCYISYFNNFNIHYLWFAYMLYFTITIADSIFCHGKLINKYIMNICEYTFIGYLIFLIF